MLGSRGVIDGLPTIGHDRSLRVHVAAPSWLCLIRAVPLLSWYFGRFHPGVVPNSRHLGVRWATPGKLLDSPRSHQGVHIAIKGYHFLLKTQVAEPRDSSTRKDQLQGHGYLDTATRALSQAGIERLTRFAALGHFHHQSFQLHTPSGRSLGSLSVLSPLRVGLARPGILLSPCGSLAIQGAVSHHL